jgi:hypothetical protein
VLLSPPPPPLPPLLSLLLPQRPVTERQRSALLLHATQLKHLTDPQAVAAVIRVIRVVKIAVASSIYS